MAHEALDETLKVDTAEALETTLLSRLEEQPELINALRQALCTAHEMKRMKKSKN